eukprot:TRINITY_DN112273_c0_g1_i1.p1 TRINITY_DN112273_c0_g1~~TRINITY_DN112273_c0_g1_i1.p1  ORF type:complete len:494 (-),score=123.10 TRINITY_DN112273_c0_g1_i1:55-1536(-)
MSRPQSAACLAGRVAGCSAGPTQRAMASAAVCVQTSQVLQRGFCAATSSSATTARGLHEDSSCSRRKSTAAAAVAAAAGTLAGCQLVRLLSLPLAFSPALAPRLPVPAAQTRQLQLVGTPQLLRLPVGQAAARRDDARWLSTLDPRRPGLARHNRQSRALRRVLSKLSRPGAQALVPEEEVQAADVADDVVKGCAEMVKKISGRLVGLRRQVADPAEAQKWQDKGNRLLSVPKKSWHKGKAQIEAPDYANLDEATGQPKMEVIELIDADKDLQENAKLFFKKARKLLRAAEKVTPMVEAGEAKLERWEKEVAAVQDWRKGLESGSPDASAEVMRLYNDLIEEGVLRKPEPPPPPPDPEEEARRAFKRKYGKDVECYRSPVGGHEVVVGRSSKMNEYVSLKLAKGDMVWFHTDRRIPGSHVLIRAPWDEVADEDIEFAAKIAAYHSKAKNDYNVPVMYCRGHQVRKMKGSPQGMVTINGNSFQILVEPGLPTDQ